ncbi:sugar phosphate isomerase/epimerase [soil metagenome]
MYLGISTYTFPWKIESNNQTNHTEAIRLMRFAVKHQIQFVQFGDNLPLHKLTRHALLKLKNYAITNNIQIEVGTKQLSEENILQYVAICSLLEAPFLRMIIDDGLYKPRVKEVIELINKILPVLDKKKVVLAIENHDRFTSKQLRQIIKNTSTKHVGICLDTANSLGAGEGVNEVLGILGPYTVNLHIKDIMIKRVVHKMGFHINGTSAGEGMLDIPGIISALDKTGKCKTATLEIWSEPLATMEETINQEMGMAIASIQYLKKYLS